jgi:hypothetical protein
LAWFFLRFSTVAPHKNVWNAPCSRGAYCVQPLEKRNLKSTLIFTGNLAAYFFDKLNKLPLQPIFAKHKRAPHPKSKGNKMVFKKNSIVSEAAHRKIEEAFFEAVALEIADDKMRPGL